MEVSESGAVRDTDDGCVLQPLGQQLVHRLLARFVQRRGGLVEEQPFRFVQYRSGDSHPLLFAARELLRPVVLFIKPIHKSRQASSSERITQLRIAEGFGGRRVAYYLAQGADGKVRTLRQEEGLEVAGLPDLPCPEGPDSGDSAKERTFTRTGRAFDEHTVSRFDARVDPGNQHTSRGQPQLQVAQLQVVNGEVGNHRRPRTSAALFLSR